MPLDPFIGRAEQLELLRDWFDGAVRTGAGRFVLVTGAPGMGKTRLCAEFARATSSLDVAVAVSRCWVGAGGPPLWPWSDLLVELGGREPIVPTGGDRFRMFRAVAQELRLLSATRPVVAILDDLHAANGDLLLLTSYVARSLHRCPMLLIATWRLGDPAVNGRSDELAAITSDASVIELPPFDGAQIAAFLEANRGGDVHPDEVERLLQCTEGNPMYLAELVRRPAGDHADADGLALALARRVADRRPSQRRVLGAAALLGVGSTVAETARVVRRRREEVIEAVHAAGSGATLCGSEIRFSHELVRAAYGAAVPIAESRRLHLAARDAIRGRDLRQVIRRAHHAVMAAALSAEDTATAVEACLDAATCAQRSLAFEQACAWAATACDLAVGSSDPAIEARALLSHASALLACGRLGAANALFDQAVGPAEDAHDPRLLAEAALGLGGVWVEEQRDELARRRMLGLCRRAIAELPADERLLLARLAVRLAAERAYDGEEVDVARAVAGVRACGDAAAVAEALSLWHHTMLVPEVAAERLRVAEDLLDVAAVAGATVYSTFGLCWRTVDLYLLGDARAERAFIDLREQATALGNQAVSYIVSVLDVMRTFRRGDLERAEAMAGDAVELGMAAGDNDAVAYYGGHLLAIRWAQGRLGEMRETVASVMDSSTLRRHDLIYPALLAYTTAVNGDRASARAILDDLLADGVDGIPTFSTWSGTMLVLVEAAAELDDAELAAALAARFISVAHLPVMPSLAVTCLGPGQRVVARALATAGQLDDAVRWFRAAIEANRRLHNRPFGAIIDAELATVLLARGEPGDDVEADQLLAAAIETGRTLGMAARVERWEGERTRRRVVGRPAMAVLQGSLERHGGNWVMRLADRSATVEHVVGMSYVAELLTRPGVEVSAVDLSAAVAGGGPVDPCGRAALAQDDRARAEYRNRLEQLDRELDRADLRGDVERGRLAAEERDDILAQLRRDTGRRGRPRRLTDESERSRMRVSKAIRRAVARVRSTDPVLGRALESRIRTGHLCCYEDDPGEPIAWVVRAH